MSRDSLASRTWSSLTGVRTRREVLPQGRERTGYGLWLRFWASLTGVRLAPRPADNSERAQADMAPPERSIASQEVGDVWSSAGEEFEPARAEPQEEARSADRSKAQGREAGRIEVATSRFSDLEDRIGLQLDPGLLERALTHRSFAYEMGGLPTNERLEFLGDSVLGLVVTDALYRRHPDLSEGQLAKRRAAVVNMRALSEVARTIDLGAYIQLGRGEEVTGGRDKAPVLADALEALIGCVYLDLGLGDASALVHRLFDPMINGATRLEAGLDWKTSLQELATSEGFGVPEYDVTESGPEHQKRFQASVWIGAQIYGEGDGRSKKEAEQKAAEAASMRIRTEQPQAPGRSGSPNRGPS